MWVDKKLVIKTANVGYDVAGGQYDVMIPGGGAGLFNGCAQIFGTGYNGCRIWWSFI